MTTARKPRISATRLAADSATVLDELGLLADLAVGRVEVVGDHRETTVP